MLEGSPELVDSGAVSIRSLEYPDDVPQLLSFMPELYESNFPGLVVDAPFLARQRSRLKEAAKDVSQSVLVAEDREGICGFIWVAVELGWNGRRLGEVRALFVDRRRRGQGLGRRLMQEGEEFLRLFGCQSVMLMVTSSNAAACGLYHSMGYETTRYQMEKPLRKGAR